MKVERCPLCKGEVRARSEDRQIVMFGRRVTLSHDFSSCDRCGNEFFTAEQMDAVQRTAATVIREAEGLLQPEEIRALRKRLRLSQASLERLLGVGAKTVARWERGTIFQAKTADKLMRVMDKYPDVACWIGRDVGIEINAGMAWFGSSFGTAITISAGEVMANGSPWAPGTSSLPAAQLSELGKGAA